jgi:hypothetical protein
MRGALLVLTFLPPPSRAETRSSVCLGGTYALGATTFSESRTFTEFAEAGGIDANYRAHAGPGVEGGVRYMLSRRFGFAAALGYLKRGESATYAAALPHPLYFDRPRLVSGNSTGLSYRETASHLDLVLAAISAPRREVLLLAGVSLFKVRADLIDHIQYAQTYPYDTVSAVSAPAAPLENSAVGFNLGASFEQKLSGHFGLGAQGRFSRATAQLHPSGGKTLSLQAGGFQVVAGVRLLF